MADSNTWIVSGLRTPFTKVDGGLAKYDAIAMSVPVVQAMDKQVKDGKIDVAVWGTVAGNLTWSNIAREVLQDAGLDPTIPAFSTVMACSTSAAAAIQAAGLIAAGNADLALAGGVESMSRVQIGITQSLSDWLRRLSQARTMKDRVALVSQLPLKDLGLYIPSVANRTTGKSMGEHTEEMAKEWKIDRIDQDEIALASHHRAVEGYEKGFFQDLIVPVDGVDKDAFPRPDTSLARLSKLKPVFDRKSGSLTAGNSSPLTDGAAGVWVASDAGLERLDPSLPRVKLVDWELAGVDIHNEGLLMAPGYALPRLLDRNGLTYDDVGLFEVHEAFAAQVLSNVEAWNSPTFLKEKAGVETDLGKFPLERMNPNGGSIAIGHPFGATGARILSQATKELAGMPSGTRAVVSICADGGLGTVLLLENP